MAADFSLILDGPTARPTIAQRGPEAFWAKCEPDLNSGCWLWTGMLTRCGYGTVHPYGKRQPRTGAHRWALQISGVNPEGWIVLHKCDTPACVSPSHLRLGTHADNVADKVAKGRQGTGSTGHKWKARPGSIRQGAGHLLWGTKKTHCKHGHEFTPENTTRGQGGTQRCRQCCRNRARASMAIIRARRKAS